MHRQGDAGIGESDRKLDGHLPESSPRDLDPGEWRLGHFVELYGNNVAVKS